ncbi:hypothetical protein AN189_04115 [Loktanella sp. 3ANDIMAR09]|nr:hypothetical protein AN189_04115 [Loktanella sp. 3ANDIMAR09]
MNRHAAIAALVLLPATGLSQTANEPLSAIDWLSQSVAITAPVPPVRRDEPSVASRIDVPQVTVTPLGASGFGAVGILAPRISGLPADLWQASTGDDVTTLINAQASPGLPALHGLLSALLLTRAEAPAGAELPVLIARIDKLLDLALLPQAQALIDTLDATRDPALFRRWFDVALLTGSEDDACRAMQASPSLAPTVSARVFCLARAGDWSAAALTVNTNAALGDLDADEELLLSRFLDPELFEAKGPMAAPDRISPLVFRLRGAIGEGLATARLPLAFAYADLGDTVGLKSRLDAAERLAMHNALPAASLSDLYLARTPSASGGVWDRVDAFQEFHAATRIADASAMAATLPAAWDAMQAIRAETLFATLYADDLDGLDDPEVFDIVRKIRHLAGQPAPGGSALVQALLSGDPADVPTRTTVEAAISAGFDGAPPSAQLDALLQDGRTGEALLRAIAIFDAGAAGDGPAITDALRVLRAAGQDRVARQAAIELLLLDRRT